MKILGVLALILVVLIVFIALLLVIYKHYNSKLEYLNEKLNDAKDEFLDMFKDKYELIIRFIEEVENKYKIESKTFDEIKEIDSEKVSSLKNELLLNKCYKELLQIKEDNQKNKEIKAFREIIDKYEDNELHIISLRTFYNKYAVKFNNLIKKFPYSIVSSINKYATISLLEGKEIDSDFINDMEV